MFEYPAGFVASVHSRKPICGVIASAICELDDDSLLTVFRAFRKS